MTDSHHFINKFMKRISSYNISWYNSLYKTAKITHEKEHSQWIIRYAVNTPKKINTEDNSKSWVGKVSSM